MATAPLNLVYAFDMSKLNGAESEKIAAAAACVAMVGENVYLYCASATGDGVSPERARRDAGQGVEAYAAADIQFAQTVGYPKA